MKAHGSYASCFTFHASRLRAARGVQRGKAAPVERGAARFQRAFTLIEVMVAMTTGVLILGIVMTVWVELYKDFTAAEGYHDIHMQARRSLELFSKDARSATNLVNFTSSNITLNAIDSTGAVDQVSYQLVNNNFQRTVTSGGVTSTTNLLTQVVTYIDFEQWTKPGTPATSNGNTYELRLTLIITNLQAFRTATDTLQTRVKMRNMH